jgi:hypothetical protein
MGTLLKKETDHYYFVNNHMTRVGDTFVVRRR